MRNNKTFIIEESMLVSSADTDFTKTLRSSSLVNMLIQIAWHHAEKLGFGMEFLHINDLIWMLSRMHLKIYSKPFWNSQLQLRTWPKGIHRLFYLRDFEVLNESNQVVAEATSEWLIIDLKTRRPKLYQPENNIFQENKDKHAIETNVPNLKTPSNEFNVFMNKVVYSDIDLNNHLTTTRYIDWMMDTFNLKFLEKSLCNNMVTNFVRELPFGTEVVIKRFELSPNENYVFEFYSNDMTQVYFRGQLNFTAT
jgi:medium-chain acyl-[acyl-carrier-protein] hydrolase